jgi:hypothetical protein
MRAASVSGDTEFAIADSMPALEFGGEMSEMPAPSFDDGVTPVPMPTAIPSPAPDDDVIKRPDEQINPGTLTAGEWNDNANWEFWQKLMSNREWHSLQSKWGISWKRYIIRVSDGENPVRNARVTLYEGDAPIWSAVTDKNGDAFVFAETVSEQGNSFSLAVKTDIGETTFDNVILTNDKPYAVEAPGSTVQNAVDVMFMIDTTGSMGDELQYINEELSDVIERVGADVRISCNFYRDIDDEYIVRPFPFTTSVDEAVGQISKQFAAGGGDYPEAVELALLNGIDEHEWNEDAKERIMFLVLDAPPHYDGERAAKIQECVRKAADKGIRIVPVASSGVDKETEFLLRSLSIATNGAYVFLTDHSGIGNSHIEPTRGE